MGCRGRPLFDLNELPNEGDEENDAVLNLQPQRALPSLSARATELFAPSEGGQRILNSSAFSHEPSVSGFQPFVRPKVAQIDRNVKQQTTNYVNSNVASSSKTLDKTVHYEEKKEVPLLVPVLAPLDAQAVEKEEGEWSDADDSVDALPTKPSTNKDEGLKTDKLEIEINQGITKTVGLRSSDKVSESISREIMNTEFPRDEVINTAKDNTTHGSYKLDTQQAELINNTADRKEEPSLALKQRDVKGVEAIHALKSANNHGKKHKLDHHKEAMLGKKRSRQTMFLNLEDVKQAGSIKTSTPRRQPVSSTLISRPVKEVRTVTGFPERSVEKQGQLTSTDQKPTDISNNEVVAPTEYSDHKFDSNGDMNAGIQSRTSRINNVNDVSSEVYPPSIPRQGSLKQATDVRQIKNPPLFPRRPFGGGQGSENLKAGGKKLPLVKKQPMNNTAQYNDTSVERLLREVTNDKFWHHPEATDLQCVPGRFESVEEYVRVFEPLLFEECRAQLYSTWEEQLESVSRDSHVMVRVRSVERRERGWYDVILLPTHECKWTFKEGDVAVLSCPRPGVVRPKRSEDDVESEVSGRVAGTVRRHIPIDTRDPLGAIFHFYVGDTYDPSSNEDDHVLKKLQPKGIWYLTVLGTLATTQREYIALHAFRRLNLQMQTAILRPSREQFPKYEEQPPAMPDCFTTNFVEHLHRSFNAPQLSAIQWAAMHTASGTSTGVSKRQDPWPFTLVQGPPGTGKTHTVWGMLNVIHLVQYQHYYTALLKKLAPESYKQPIESVSESVGTGSIDEVLQSMDQNLLRTLPKLCPKPRMLVCAPSNAATDELLTRVLDRGFIDGEMKVYFPDVARVGVDTQTRAAQAVSVERRTEQLLGKGRDEIVSFMHQLKIREAQLAAEINCYQRELTVAAAAGRSQGSVGVDPDILVARDHNRDTLLQNLASSVEQRDKVLVEMSRLYIVEGKFRPGSNFNLEDARSNLEASFANEAEILFTTVSSSGRKLFTRLTHGFDMVVIDEAAQASEVGVLPPLALSAARCVLVGDPQQLPATVISKAAGTLLYSRSLFERFQQAGCPTILLSVQYRMHPQIRDFPSRYFYQGRLTDSESVSNLPDEIYYKDPLLRPYVFYDVTHGRESHRGGSVSYQNIHEAQFCFRLYEHLQKNLKSLGASKVTVGIITPYKLQLKCLQREFEAVLNSEEGKDIYINTVDAFQGQERDVIIMSCVRASNHGVGFVADVRRMNVALTRARRALWVMGNANSLMRSDDWAALITDAKARNCYVDMESLPKEFLSAKNSPYTSMPMKASSNMRNPRTGGGRHRHFDMHSHTDSKSGTPSEEDEKSSAATIPPQRNGGYRNTNYSKALLIENNNNNSTMDDAMQMADKSRDAWQYGIQQKKQQNSAGVLGGTKRDSS
ncbi:hypothetical protein ACHQM5_022418 [Ranunculus cassubicifolius]